MILWHIGTQRPILAARRRGRRRGQVTDTVTQKVSRLGQTQNFHGTYPKKHPVYLT